MISDDEYTKALVQRTEAEKLIQEYETAKRKRLPPGFWMRRNEAECMVGNSPDWFAYPADTEPDSKVRAEFEAKGFHYFRHVAGQDPNG